MRSEMEALAERIVAVGRGYEPATVSTAPGQFSRAGAQPKVALHRDGARWGVPRGRTPTTHILKPAVSHLDDHDLNEHLCLKLGRAIGLTAARSSIETFSGERAVRDFLDAVIFNWLMAGTDGHAKNHSLLLSGAQVRLAPLYDVASFLPYNPYAPKLKLAMRIGGEYRLGVVERRHWERLAGDVGIDAAERETRPTLRHPRARADLQAGPAREDRAG